MSEVNTTTNVKEEVEAKKEETEQKDSDYSLKIEKIKFEPHFEIRKVNSLEIETLIDSVFAGNIAPDYAGCKILINDPVRFRVPEYIRRNFPPNAPFIAIRFDRSNNPNPNAGSEDSNIISRAEASAEKSTTVKKGESIDRLKLVYGYRNQPRNRTFTITERTKQTFRQFLFDNDLKNYNKHNWEDKVEEHPVVRTFDGARIQTTCLELYGLDIRKFLAAIYGNGAENDNDPPKYFYNFTVLDFISDPTRKPFGGIQYQGIDPNGNPIPMPNEDAEFLISITKMDAGFVNSLIDYKHLGMARDHFLKLAFGKDYQSYK